MIFSFIIENIVLLTSLVLLQPQQSRERGEVLNAPLQNDISLYDLNIPLINEKLLRMEEYIKVWQGIAECCEVIKSSEQNSQELSGTVEFSKVLSSTEKNGKKSQRADNFDWKEFLRELL